jgi:hypothetical protein
VQVLVQVQVLVRAQWVGVVVVVLVAAAAVVVVVVVEEEEEEEPQQEIPMTRMERATLQRNPPSAQGEGEEEAQETAVAVRNRSPATVILAVAAVAAVALGEVQRGAAVEVSTVTTAKASRCRGDDPSLCLATSWAGASQMLARGCPRSSNCLSTLRRSKRRRLMGRSSSHSVTRS